MTHPVVKIALRGVWSVALAAVVIGGGLAHATSVKRMNLVDLVEHAETIVAGRVEAVTDGFDDDGLPYTEVTLSVAEKLRGDDIGDTFTFRQFGLLRPRTMPTGKVALARTPDGWARFAEGETVALFLDAPARLTGFRAPVGLKQGKLAVVNGRILRDEYSATLFEAVDFDPRLLDRGERALVERGRSREDVDVEAFLELVRRAVREEWVGKGRMRHAR